MFVLTLNMPSREGRLVHQIMADHPCKSLNEFVEHIKSHDFIVVEEYYKEDRNSSNKNEYYSRGDIAINTMHIGKVKMMYGDDNTTE